MTCCVVLDVVQVVVVLEGASQLPYGDSVTMLGL